MLFVVVIFYLIVPNLLALSLNETIPSNKPAGRIVGGSDAPDIATYPYQVSLRDLENRHFCGGSIIHTKWILTAVHCVIGKMPDEIKVFTGTYYRTDSNSANSHIVTQIISHELYDNVTIFNDIALLKVNPGIKFNARQQRIKLSNIYPASGTLCTLTGWGLTSYPSNNLPNNLQHIELHTISLAECRSQHRCGSIYKGHLCTRAVRGKGACSGDSGGPLVAGKRQIGIVSAVILCAIGYPDMYTSVSVYFDWILKNTGLSKDNFL